MHADGRNVLAWVAVRIGDQLTFCAQRSVVTDRLIRSIVDLYVDEGESEPPEWRAELLARVAVEATEPIPALNEES